MSLNYNDIVKQGYVKLKGQKVGVWKKQWVILKKSSSKGQRRFEKYQDEKSSILGHEHKRIDLMAVKQIYKLPPEVKKHGVGLVFFDGSQRQLACDSDMDADNWVDVLREECIISPNNNTILNPDILRNVPTPQVTDDVYNVYLLPSPNLDIYGECLMVITVENIDLLDVEDPTKKLVSWPLGSLRRYGTDEAKFTFEAGRHCDTGEGLFVFNTTQGEKIYKSVHSSTETIAAAYRVSQSVSRRQQEQMNASTATPEVPERPAATLQKSKSVEGPVRPPPATPTGRLHPSNSFPNTRKAPAPPPTPTARSLPPLPPDPAGEYDILARSYSGQPPTPPPPRKNSVDLTALQSPRKLSTSSVGASGSRNPSTSSAVSSPGSRKPSTSSAISSGSRNPSVSSSLGSCSSPLTDNPTQRLLVECMADLDMVPDSDPPPPPPPPMRTRSQEDDELDYIYEEKGLGVAFRKFLAGRKE